MNILGNCCGTGTRVLSLVFLLVLLRPFPSLLHLKCDFYTRRRRDEGQMKGLPSEISFFCSFFFFFFFKLKMRFLLLSPSLGPKSQNEQSLSLSFLVWFDRSKRGEEERDRREERPDVEHKKGWTPGRSRTNENDQRQVR